MVIMVNNQVVRSKDQNYSVVVIEEISKVLDETGTNLVNVKGKVGIVFTKVKDTKS